LSALQVFVYQILKVIIRLFARLYYPGTLVLGREYFRLSGPNIVVANHPNTLIDPLSAAFRLNKPLFYLANAGLYKYAFMRKLLKFLYAIRVERPQDVNGRPVNNERAFGAAVEMLSKGYSIFIAPEGTSEMERRLRPLRTGTARIALQAEAAHDFALGLRILPIGLTYEKPEESGSGLIVHAGVPIMVNAWEMEYRENPWQAVLSLTQAISDHLEALMLNTRDQVEEQLLAGLEEILAVAAPCTMQDSRVRSRQLLEKLRDFETRQPEDFSRLRQDAEDYAVQKAHYGLREWAFSPQWGELIILLFTLPLWLWAWIHHYFVPVLALRHIGHKLKLYIGYSTTLKWLGSFLILPFWYGILVAVVPGVFPYLHRTVYIPLLIVSGPVFVLLRPLWRNFTAGLRGLFLRILRPEAWIALTRRRTGLLKQVFAIMHAQQHAG
jgi:1-acyl-sn-glycerol-3-phosphate acyltransferase